MNAVPYRSEVGHSDFWFSAHTDFTKWMNHVIGHGFFLRNAALTYEIDYDTKKGHWRWEIRWVEVPADKVEIADRPTLPMSGIK